MIPLGLVLATTACDPPVVQVDHGNNIQLDLKFTAGVSLQVENQVVVLPKGTPACPDGAIVYTTGGGAGRVVSSANAGQLGVDPLDCVGTTPCFEPAKSSKSIFFPTYSVPVAALPGSGPCSPTSFTDSAPAYTFKTDNTVTRVDQNGTLLATFKGNEQQSPPESPCDRTVSLRAAIGLAVSHDCGANWEPASTPAIVATNPDHVDGFDRQVVYTSPWGPDDTRHDIILAAMDIPDTEEKWSRSLFHAYSDDLGTWTGPVKLKSFSPRTASSITSTPPTSSHPRGGVFVVTCGTILGPRGAAATNRATLHVSRDGGVTFGEPIDITRVDSNGASILCEGVSPDHLAGKTRPAEDDMGNPIPPSDMGMKNMFFPSITRVQSSNTSDVVRVAYPRVRKSSEGVDIQTYVMQIVRFDANDSAPVVLSAGGLSEDPYSIIFLDFVQTDRWDTGPLAESDPSSNRTVAMYYKSSYVNKGSPPLYRNEMTARYYAIEGVSNVGTGGDLAMHYEGTSTVPSTLWWTPIGSMNKDCIPTGRCYIGFGDYNYNGFYATPNNKGGVDFNYLMTWTQPKPGIVDPNGVYFFNTLTTTP